MNQRKHHSRKNQLAYERLEPRMVLSAWLPQGPFSATDGQVENIAPQDRVVGAVHTVLAHPTEADVLYIGGTNSGVWRTYNATDANPNWTPLTDDMPSQSIGALVFDVADSTNQTIYAGTGRYSSFGRLGNNRVGLYQSVNGGDSWTLLNDNLDGANISGIAANGSNIVVSVNTADNFDLANTGIFRSTNGGVSFTRMSVGDGSGASGLPEGASYDLVADPLNPDILYTSMVFADQNTSGINGVYKSSDGGATWARVSNATMDALIMSSGTSNLELAVGQADNVYAAIINFGNLAGLFRSGDGGGSWVQMDTPSTNENGTDVGLNPRGGKGPQPGDNPTPEELAGGQGNIHFSILADPTDPNIVYVGGDRQPRSDGDAGSFPNSIGATDFTGRLFRGDASAPAGSQFVHLTHSSSLGAAGGGTASSSAPHADSREMVFDALGQIIEVDDGGIYRRTSPRDNTGDWFALTGDLQVSESHNVAYDNNSNTFLTGNQDTGTTYQPSEGAKTWISLSTADGGDVAVDSVSLAAQGESIRYTSSQNLGGFRQTTYDSNGTILSVNFPSLSGFGGDGVFVTPVEVNRIDPLRIAIQGGSATYESLDQAENVTSLSAGGNQSFLQNAVVYGGFQNAIPNPDLLWVGSGSEVLVRTTAGGTLTATTDPGFGLVRDLAVDPDDWARAFAVDSNQVFMTEDIGVAWTDITGNLLTFADSLYSAAYVATTRGDAIVAGTNQGVFASLMNDIGVWYEVGANLPNALVFDMQYDATDDVLAAGTLGRGAWSLPLASIIVVPGLLQDFGDAPDALQSGFAGSYPVTILEGGASHLDAGPTLGASRDIEINGTHSSNADFDDLDQGVDDEDGISFIGRIVGSTTAVGMGTISVDLQNADPVSNRLDAWIDWNRDGDWDDAGEQIFTSYDLGTVNGTQNATFTIPTLAQSDIGTTYARFRLSTNGGLTPVGISIDGEVEDHVVDVENAVETTEGDDVIVVTIDDLVNIDINGVSFQVDPNLVSSYTLNARGGNDMITVFDSVGTDVTTIRDHELAMSGVFNFIATSVENVRLVSRGGDDVANLMGTNFDDVFESFGASGRLHGFGYVYETTDYPRTNAFGMAGLDRGFLSGTDGDDRFYANNIFANLQTPDVMFNLRDFTNVSVHSNGGGFDIASLIGTDATDNLFANDSIAILTTAVNELTTIGFDRNWTDGRGGDDVALLAGDSGNETFNATQTTANLFGSGFFNQAIRFEDVTVDGNGGLDTANITDSPGNDVFYATPTHAVLFNANNRIQVNGYGQVSAVGSAGFDRATFIDSDGDDLYVARPDDAFISGKEFFNYALNFNAVTARSSGGMDQAVFHSSFGDDHFFGSKTTSYLAGSTFFNQAIDFTNVSALIAPGGFDVGLFEDSADSETFVGTGDRAVLFNDDYLVFTSGLDLAVAKSLNGGTDVLATGEIEFEIRVSGNWT